VIFVSTLLFVGFFSNVFTTSFFIVLVVTCVTGFHSIFPMPHLLLVEIGLVLLFPFLVKVLEVSLLVLGSYERLFIIHSTFDFGVSDTAFCIISASSFVIFFHLASIDFIL